MPAILWEELLNFESDNHFYYLSLHGCDDNSGLEITPSSPLLSSSVVDL